MSQRYRRSEPPILAPGILGATGAFLILVADIIYNLFNGDQPGLGLVISTYFGVFLFPLWWGGIWVIYQGLKPAGTAWSLYPCLLFAFLVSTINVFGHSVYPFYAVLHEVQRLATGPDLAMLGDLESRFLSYTNPIYALQSVVEAIVAVWLTIPIVRGKTMFPRWMAALIPIYPLGLSFLINLMIPGFFSAINPFIASGCLCLIFVIATVILTKSKGTSDANRPLELSSCE